MTVRPIFVGPTFGGLPFALAALGAVLAGCAAMPNRPAPAPTAMLSPDDPVGHSLDEVTAINGPPAQQWDLPDGRRVYQWQSSSITARASGARTPLTVGRPGLTMPAFSRAMLASVLPSCCWWS